MLLGYISRRPSFSGNFSPAVVVVARWMRRTPHPCAWGLATPSQSSMISKSCHSLGSISSQTSSSNSKASSCFTSSSAIIASMVNFAITPPNSSSRQSVNSDSYSVSLPMIAATNSKYSTYSLAASARSSNSRAARWACSWCCCLHRLLSRLSSSCQTGHARDSIF